MRLSHRRVRTRIGVAIAACLLLVGAVGERQARAQLTPSDVLSIVDAIKGAYSAYTDFRSLVDGTDVSTATLINDARDAIISEMHGIVETSVEDDIEASIRDWLEVTQTLQAFPQNNNSIMLGRVSGLLDGTQLDWVTLKNIILTSNDLTLVKKALPAFNTVTALRVTMMKALAQFNPPMRVPQDTIDQVVIDALQVDYAAIGARIASYSGNPRDPNPVAHLHQSGLVAAKRLYPMFFSSQAVYSCSGTCTPYLTHFSGNGAGGVCNTAHHGTATTCHGSDCGTTDNLCGDVRNVQNGSWWAGVSRWVHVLVRCSGSQLRCQCRNRYIRFDDPRCHRQHRPRGDARHRAVGSNWTCYFVAAEVLHGSGFRVHPGQSLWLDGVPAAHPRPALANLTSAAKAPDLPGHVERGSGPRI